MSTTAYVFPIRKPVGTVIRIDLEYAGTLRRLGWLRVGRDGSIYFGISGAPSKTGSKAHLLRVPIIDSRAELDLNSIPETFVEDPVGKVSFHPSGATHAAFGRSWRPSTRTLTDRQQIASMLFRHPRDLRVIEPVRRRPHEIAIHGYPVDDDSPLHGRLVVAPSSIDSPFRDRTFVRQVNVMFRFEELPDLSVELVLGDQGRAAPWPPLSWIMWLALEERVADDS